MPCVPLSAHAGALSEAIGEPDQVREYCVSTRRAPREYPDGDTVSTLLGGRRVLGRTVLDLLARHVRARLLLVHLLEQLTRLRWAPLSTSEHPEYP